MQTGSLNMPSVVKKHRRLGAAVNLKKRENSSINRWCTVDWFRAAHAHAAAASKKLAETIKTVTA